MSNPNKTAGGLYQLKSSVVIDENSYWNNRFCFVVGDLIDNKALWDVRYLIDHDVLLMLVKSNVALSMETARATEAGVGWGPSAMAAAAASAAATMTTVMEDYELARKQWREDNCIPGLVFMIPDGRHIWISNIDFEYFEEVEL